MDGISNPHPQCTRSIKKPVMEQETCERAKTRVQVVADIQNFALRAHCVSGIPKVMACMTHIFTKCGTHLRHVWDATQ